MAKSRDGGVYLDSGIATKGFVKDSKVIIKSAEKTANTVQKMGKKMSTTYDRGALEYIYKDSEKATKSTNKFKKEIESAKNRLKELEKAGKWYKDADYDEAARELASLTDEAKQYKKELTTGTIDNPFGAGTVSAELFEAQQKFNQIVAEGGGLGEQEYDEAYIALAKAKEAYSAYKKELTAKPEEPITPKEVEQVEQFETAIETATEKTNNFSKVSSKLGKVAKTVSSGVGRLASKIVQVGNKKTDASISSSVKTIFRYIFGIESLFFLMNKVRSFAAEGLTNLSKESVETKDNINSLKASLIKLKNSFASAFSPVINVAVPALVSIINYSAKAINYVGMLIAALTGSSTYQQAKTIQSDLAESLDGTADSAENAASSLNDYLSPIDEINKLSSDSGSGSSATDMFEEVAIESSISNLAAKIKSYIDSEDFEGLGEYLAEKVNIGLNKVYKVISWSKVGPKVTTFTKKFTTTFNSFVKKLDAKKLGNTIGAGIDTVIRTVNGFVDNISWKTLGTKFGESIEGVVDEIDGKQLGKFLSNKFKIAINFVSGAVTTLPWSKVGTKLADTLNGIFENIDPQEIANIMNQTISGAIELLKAFIKTTDWGNVLDAFLEIFDGLNTETKIAGLGAILGSFLLSAFGASISGGFITAAALGAILLPLVSKAFSWVGKKLNLATTLFKSLGDKVEENEENIKAFQTFLDKFETDVTMVVDAVTGDNFDKTKKYADYVLSKNGKKATITADVSASSKKSLKTFYEKYWSLIKSKTITLSLSLAGIPARTRAALGLATGGIYKNGKWQKIEGYASGGYPTKSRLFYANENGMPELVGRIGSNTAVMNNGQIVASVAAGVYQAVAAAFSQLHNYFAQMTNTMARIPEALDRYASITPNANIPIPALATGSVVPPKAVIDRSDIKSLKDSIDVLNRQIEALKSVSKTNQTGVKSDYRFTAYVGRKVLFDEVIAEAKLQQQITNNNPFDLK